MNFEVKTVKFSEKIKNPKLNNLITETLGSKIKATKFITRISSAVAINPSLQDCDASTIICAGLLGESLNLSPSPQLGHYYIVPYKNKAVLQIGYKGLLQLAIRSGAYKKINVIAIKDGELIHFNQINEEIEISLIEDINKREITPTIGYYAFFELISGFKKCIFWTKEQMEKHARRFSKCYEKFWAKEFDKMALKTILKKIIGTWGILSDELNLAIENDNIIKDSDNNINFLEENLEINTENNLENNSKNSNLEININDL